MFDLANANIAQLESLFAELEKKLDNPFEKCKINIQLAVQDLLDWCDKRLAKDQSAFINLRAGLETQIAKHFEELTAAITTTVTRAAAGQGRADGQSD